MFSGQGLAQDLVEGQGRAIAGRGLQQDLVPGRGRKTYPGGRGMGCDYNIIDHLEKFSQFALKKAYFNCKFCGNSPEVANWAIMITIGPRANRDHDYPVGEPPSPSLPPHKLGNHDHDWP